MLMWVIRATSQLSPTCNVPWGRCLTSYEKTRNNATRRGKNNISTSSSTSVMKRYMENKIFFVLPRFQVTNMGFKMPHVTVIGGLVASGIALLFQVIAVAAAGWIKQTNADYTGGLWKVCYLNGCQDIPSYWEAGEEIIARAHTLQQHTQTLRVSLPIYI